MGQEAILTFFFEFLNVQKQLKGNSLQHIYITIKYHQAKKVTSLAFIANTLVPEEIVVEDFLEASLLPFVALFRTCFTEVFGGCRVNFCQ